MASPAVLFPASLYVGDLHHDVTDKDLFDAFSPISGLLSVRVCLDSMTGRSLGYGYIDYISHPDGNSAVSSRASS